MYKIISLLGIVISALVLLTGCDSRRRPVKKEIVIVKVPVPTPAPAPAPVPVVEPDTVVATPAPVEEVPVVEEAPAPEPAVPDAPYEEGMTAYEAGNGIGAIQAFNRSVYPEAYYMLGIIYEQGCGTIGKNPMLARKNFKKAATMGSVAAQSKL